MSTPYIRCTACNKETDWPARIEIKGYYPNNAGGILICESARHHSFCSHACAVKWMRWAISHELPEPVA